MRSSTFGAIAPYVIHSVDLGSEILGDCLGVEDWLVPDLKTFRSRINGYKIPAGISDNWDTVKLRDAKDGPLNDEGRRVKSNSDYVHAHIMPYYDTHMMEVDAWTYIADQISWLNRTVQLPTLITETQWAWGLYPGSSWKPGLRCGPIHRVLEEVRPGVPFLQAVQRGLVLFTPGLERLPLTLCTTTEAM